jgi:tetratricopeptide (TPR) repeat protein
MCSTGAVVLVLALLAGSSPVADPVARGLLQLEQGDLDSAIETLAAVVQELSRDPARSRDLARAHTYLGIAYLLQDQERAGLASFREALRLDPGTSIPADRFPPRVLRLFDQQRAATAPSPPLPAGAPAEQAVGHLAVDFEHDLAAGELRVLVDHVAVLTEPLDGTSRRKLLLLHRRRGGLESTIDVAPGSHTVSVEVRWADNLKQESLQAVFRPGITRRLSARLTGRFRKSLSLEWN